MITTYWAVLVRYSKNSRPMLATGSSHTAYQRVQHGDRVYGGRFPGTVGAEPAMFFTRGEAESFLAHMIKVERIEEGDGVVVEVDSDGQLLTGEGFKDG